MKIPKDLIFITKIPTNDTRNKNTDYKIKSQKCSWQWYEPPEDSAPVVFCTNTSLHGLSYLGQKQRHLCERLFWLTAFSFAVYTATYLIWQMWRASENMPIVTVLYPSEVELKQVPFPAVTVCNVNKIQKSKMDNLISNIKIGLNGYKTKHEHLQNLAYLLDIHNICGMSETFTGHFTDSKSYGWQIDQELKNKADEYADLLNPVATLQNFSQSCSDMVLFCIWQGETKNSTELFQRVETDHGFCCTFNTIPLSLLKRHDINSDAQKMSNDDYERIRQWNEVNANMDNLILWNMTKQKLHEHPRRQLYAGRGAGLSVLLDPDIDENYCSKIGSEGFLVSTNVPLDYPRMQENGIAIQTISESFINVQPEITLPDKALRKIDLMKRKCYFHDEFELQHYTKYTLHNCIDECMSRITNLNCNCTPYYLPSDLNRTVCTPKHDHCIHEIHDEIYRVGLEQSCNNCLSPCTEILYHTDVTMLPVKEQYTKSLFEKHRQYSNSKNVTILHTYFNVDSSYPRLRRQYMSGVQIIAFAGGLQSLCMGFSMLTLLELVYHGTLRLCCGLYRKRWENKRRESDNEILEGSKLSVNEDCKAQQLRYETNNNAGFLREFMQRFSAVQKTNEKRQIEKVFYPSGKIFW